MKLYLLGLLLCSGVLSASAQSVTFGIKGGFNASNFTRSNKYNPNFNRSNTVVSFQGGVFADLSLGKFSLQPAVMYTGKGGSTFMSYADDDVISHIYGKAHIYYLQVPVNLIYHVPLGKGSLLLGAGPFVSKAINGRFKAYDPLVSSGRVPASIQQRYDSDIEFSSTNYNAFKAFDYGVNGIIGLQANKISFNFNYDLGLANINPEKRTEYKTRTRTAGLSIGYIF